MNATARWAFPTFPALGRIDMAMMFLGIVLIAGGGLVLLAGMAIWITLMVGDGYE